MQKVAEVNAQHLGFELGENQFSDLNQDEYRGAAGLGYIAPEIFNGMPHLGEHLHDGSELPAEVNWVTASAVNPVKDQPLWGVSSMMLTSTLGSALERRGKHPGTVESRFYVPG